VAEHAGDSNLIEGYRDRLAGDDALETKLERVSRPVLRKLLVGAVPCVCAVLVYFAVVEEGFTRIFLGLLAVVIGWNFFSRLKLEHAIVENHRESVGKVLYRRLGVKRGALVEYEFLSADNQAHWGTVRGGLMLPRKGQTVVVVYNLGDPSLNLPLSSFWFYEFPFEFPSTDLRASS
jgi:hypothetical protein